MNALRCAQCHRYYGETDGTGRIYCRSCKVFTYYDRSGRVTDVIDRVIMQTRGSIS
jgi:protein-arginine kinase activator protein McsA